MESVYLPECEELLKRELGEETVDRVFFFDWRVSECRCGKGRDGNTEFRW